MHRLVWPAALVVLAACPPRPPGSQQPQSKSAGCPSASNVYVASFLTPAQGATHRAGWVLPLHDAPLVSGVAAPDYANLDASAAAVAGVTQAPTGNVWIVAANAAPCQAQVGKYYAVKLDDPAPNVTYGVELDGCPAPVDQNDTEALALVSQDAPSECRFEAPNPVAARLGEYDQQKQWHAPTKETPIPPAVAQIVPPHECKAPTCETLWAFAEIDIDKKPVAWSGAINWLTIGDPAKPCDWRAESFSGFFVPDLSGRPVKIDQGQKHPLVLATALVDGGGARVLLAQGPGEYATYDVVAGGASLGHTITWLLAPDAAYKMIDHLGPMCEQPGQKPPPSR
jgi:hypothetical protein